MNYLFSKFFLLLLTGTLLVFTCILSRNIVLDGRYWDFNVYGPNRLTANCLDSFKVHVDNDWLRIFMSKRMMKFVPG